LTATHYTAQTNKRSNFTIDNYNAIANNFRYQITVDNDDSHDEDDGDDNDIDEPGYDM